MEEGEKKKTWRQDIGCDTNQWTSVAGYTEYIRSAHGTHA